jgi:hypothetical protein
MSDELTSLVISRGTMIDHESAIGRYAAIRILMTLPRHTFTSCSSSTAIVTITHGHHDSLSYSVATYRKQRTSGWKAHEGR